MQRKNTRMKNTSKGEENYAVNQNCHRTGGKYYFGGLRCQVLGHNDFELELQNKIYIDAPKGGAGVTLFRCIH